MLFVPVFIVFVFFLKAIAINDTLDLTSEYLRDYVEARIGRERAAGRSLGFETYFFKKREQKEVKTIRDRLAQARAWFNHERQPKAEKKTRVRMARIRAWSYGYYALLMIVYLVMAGWGMRVLH